MEECTNGICYKCNASYKSVAERWKKDRKLKAWWQAMSGPEKVAWYKKQRDVRNVGQKRKFDV